MRILLLSNPESIWTKEFIDKVLLPVGASVSVQCDPDAQGQFDNYYRDRGVSIIGQYKLLPWMMKIPKMRVLHRALRKKKALKPYAGKFDKIIILYVTPFALECAKMLSDSHTDVYAFFIGSDILRSTPRNTARLQELLKDHTVSVVCESCQTASAFHEKIGQNISLAAHIIYLGNAVLPYINKRIKDGRNICKGMFDIPQDLISVCVGYNASPAQQHLKVIRHLKNLDRRIQDKICVVIPAAYQGTVEYLAQIQAELQSSEMEYRILTKFLDAEEAAALRIATDIFINAQITDALSASVTEAYYAGAKLLSADWLKYQEFYSWDLEYERFGSFDEMQRILARCVDAGLTHSNRNRDIVFEEQSWDTCKDQWHNLLNEGKSS